MKVKCISDQYSYITKGGVYEVIRENKGLYQVLDNDGIKREYAKSSFEIQHSKDPLINLENCKFRVNSPEHSEQIQKALFENGVKWHCGREYDQLSSRYLVVTDGVIDWTNNTLHFENNCPQQELTQEVVTSYKFTPVVVKKETIKIGDKEYDKVEFEAAVANLKAID